MSEGTAFTNSQPSDNHLEQLVGEGKKYASVEDLAKAYANADNMITELTSTNDELRKDLHSKGDVEAKLLEKLSEQKPAEQVVPATPAAKDPTVDFDALLKQAEENVVSRLENKALTKKYEENELQISKELTAKFGDSVSENLQAIAAANDTTIKGLQELAKTNPVLARNVLGLNNSQTTTSSSAPIRGNDNQQALNINTSHPEGSREWWDAKKAEDRSWYFSSAANKLRIQHRNEGKLVG